MSFTSKRLVASLLAGLAIQFGSFSASAQQVTVQQPTFEAFGVGTTVSVPVGGRTTIGGVGRSASSSSNFGPFRNNTNFGRSTQGSNLSVSATIHDFDLLDRQALDAAGGSRSRRKHKPLDPRAEHALRSLLERDGQTTEKASREPTGGNVARTDPDSEPAALSGDELLRRGLKAEASGQRGVALAFLRQARERGSGSARDELARLERLRRASPVK
ncbi:MAG: hypothetical protein ACKV0T_26765 [Planctomycetales bacterium]